MHNIQTILEDKGREIWSIKPRDTKFNMAEINLLPYRCQDGHKYSI